MRSCNLASGSPGKAAARTSAVLNVLASWLTAAPARSLSLQTCAAVNATNKPKIIPSGGSMPGETALNDLARPLLASAATPAWIASANRKVEPKTSRAIRDTGSSWNQSLIDSPHLSEPLFASCYRRSGDESLFSPHQTAVDTVFTMMLQPEALRLMQSSLGKSGVG